MQSLILLDKALEAGKRAADYARWGALEADRKAEARKAFAECLMAEHHGQLVVVDDITGQALRYTVNFRTDDFSAAPIDLVTRAAHPAPPVGILDAEILAADRRAAFVSGLEF